MRKPMIAAMAVLVWWACLAAQAAPLRLPAGKNAVAEGGSVTAVAAGALIRYRGWLLAIDAAAAPERPDITLMSADKGHAAHMQAGTLLRDLPLWSSFELIKGNTRLRITALPGPGERPALLLDFGAADYRIVIAAAGVERRDYHALAQRFPGADLALLQQQGRRVMLPLGSGSEQVFGAEQAAPFRFAKVNR